MPDITTHYRFGDMVLQSLPAQCAAPMDRAVFDTATAGPDTWFFKDFWKHLAPHDIANRMHREGGSRLLTMLLEEAKRDDRAKDALYSFVCGFVCHYTIDRRAHPYINARSGGIRGGHMKLERCIDCAALSEWKDRGFLCIARVIFRLKRVGSMKHALDAAYRAVYGLENAAEEMERCMRNQRLFYLLAQDPTGLVDAVLRGRDNGTGETDLTAVSYHAKENAFPDPLNLSHAPWAQGRSESFPELREIARREAADRLRQVYAYLYEDGGMPILGELIG